MALTESSKTPIGWEAPGFNLPGTDGKNHSLGSFQNAKGLVVVFTCNHCPYARAAWPLLTALATKYKDQSIEFVGINPNDEQEYPEDSFEEMQKRVGSWEINFPYLRDENQEVVKAYDAQCTPDIYLFDENRKLYYRGRINDNWLRPPALRSGAAGGQNPTAVTEHNLEDAIKSLLSGNPPPENQPPSIGCSIKWK